MKLTPTGPLPGHSALNLVTGYGSGYVLVNDTRHDASLIVLPERVIAWSAKDFDSLAIDDFEHLAEIDLEIVLLGTGARLRFPRRELTRPLVDARIGFEVMDLQAACRTYNFLVAESRKVAAALLFA